MLTFILSCLLCCGAPFSSSFQSRRATDVESVKRFVQQFYDWYASDVLATGQAGATRRALKERADTFSPTLSRAIGDDLTAQASVKGESVGLDIDPIVESQDPFPRYEAQEVEKKGSKYWVYVHPKDGARQGRPFVVEVGPRNHRGWQFENFYYNYDSKWTDVLSILRRLKAERTKRE